MKKLLIATACAAMINPLCASDAIAKPATGEVKRPFIANNSFKGLCDRLKWQWGDLDTNKACFSQQYAQRNNYVLTDGKWIKNGDAYKSRR